MMVLAGSPRPGRGSSSRLCWVCCCHCPYRRRCGSPFPLRLYHLEGRGCVPSGCIPGSQHGTWHVAEMPSVCPLDHFQECVLLSLLWLRPACASLPGGTPRAAFQMLPGNQFGLFLNDGHSAFQNTQQSPGVDWTPGCPVVSRPPK